MAPLLDSVAPASAAHGPHPNRLSQAGRVLAASSVGLVPLPHTVTPSPAVASLTESSAPWYATGAPPVAPEAPAMTSAFMAGTPVFGAAQTNPFNLVDVGDGANLAIVDIDGDGDLDVFIGEEFGDLFFFENTGSPFSPAFGARQTNPFNLADIGYNSAPAFVDIDGDGDLDAFSGKGDGNIAFFENTGSVTNPAFGAIQTNPFSLTNVGNAQSRPTFVDIDGDGDLDAFSGNYDGDTVFFENTGSAINPAFGTRQTNPFNLADIGDRSIPAFADVDRDGDLDAFIGTGGFTASSGNTIFFENTGSSTNPAFGAPQTNPFNLVNVESASAPTFADINSDGDLDAFIGVGDGPSDPNNGSTLLFSNLTSGAQPSFGSPSFGTPQTNPFNLTDVGYNSKPALADIDSDGDLDLFVGGESSVNTIFFENTGSAINPAFAAAQTNPFGLTSAHAANVAAAVGDIDGDGDLDLFMGMALDRILFFLNNGSRTNPSFNTAQSNPFGLTGVGDYLTPTLVDIDGDGDLDMFSGERRRGINNSNIFFFENTGSVINPAFATAQTNPFNLADVSGVMRSTSPTFADIDKDGDLDAFVGAASGKTIFFENTGSAINPAFATAQTNPFNLADVGTHSIPAFGDLDADGDLDIFIGERLGNILFASNAEVTLPVELTSFTAFSDANTVLLNWQTASETNNAGFSIEQKRHHNTHPSAPTWTPLAFIDGQGTTATAQSYQHRIENLEPGRYTFRLKQVDFDGTFSYSPTVEVSVELPDTYLFSDIFPNPFTTRTSFDLAVPFAQHVEVHLYDAQGRSVQTIHSGLLDARQTHRFEVSGEALASGLYVLLVEGERFREARSVILVK